MSNTEKQIEQEIQEKGLNAPRLTPDLIDATIVDEYYFTAAQGVGNNCNGYDAMGFHSVLGTLTFCVLILKNGFTVTGESACASPENFDAEIGKKIARENAREKIWLLEGYLLKEKLYQAQASQSKNHIDRMQSEKHELDVKLTALNAFLAKLGTDNSPLLTDEQVKNLEFQSEAMEQYSNILGIRIEYDANLFEAVGVKK